MRLPGLILLVQTHHEGTILMKNLTFDVIKETKLIALIAGTQIDREAFDALQKKLEEIKAIQEGEYFLMTNNQYIN